jgi:hypothetical protein
MNALPPAICIRLPGFLFRDNLKGGRGRRPIFAKAPLFLYNYRFQPWLKEEI